MIRRLLAENPRLETATARVQLTSYGPSSIRLELFAHVRTRDEAEFRAVREDLLLHIGEVVDNSGSGFAEPAQLFYIRPQGEAQPERTLVSEIQGRGGKGQEESRDPGRTSAVPRALPPSLRPDGQVLPNEQANVLL
jgi:hypothetical protein